MTTMSNVTMKPADPTVRVRVERSLHSGGQRIDYAVEFELALDEYTESISDLIDLAHDRLNAELDKASSSTLDPEPATL